MSYQAFTPFLELREFLDDGRLNAGGRMFFYLAGTSTLGDVYTDSTGTPGPNPVVLNGAGTARIFGPPVAYRLVIQDQFGAQLFEIDGVFPFGGSSSGSGLGTTAMVLNFNGLRGLSTDYDAVIVCGRNTAGDGGGGLFSLSPSTLPDNDGTILVRSSTRYVRIYTGAIDARWFGVQYDLPVDQMTFLDRALAVGETQVAGRVYIGTDHHLTGKLIMLPGGGFYSSLAPKLYLDGTLLQGTPGMFGSGIVPVFGANVCEALHSSWFSSVQQSLCTIWSYRYLFDADTPISASLEMPANYLVDFEGGSRLLVQETAGITIRSLAYTGVSQIISYPDSSYVGPVDLGGVDALLEWFGGQAGSGFGIDNRAAGKAAFLHGRIRLLESFYRIGADDSSWSTAKRLRVFGDSGDGTETLQLDQSVSVVSWEFDRAILTGAGTLSATGNGALDHAQVQDLQARAGASTQDVTDAAYIPASYLAGGEDGMLRISTDGQTWTSIPGVIDSLSSIARGPILVATGASGNVWKSTNGGTTWTSQTVRSTAAWHKVKWIGNTCILVGYDTVVAKGIVSVSTDAVTWNHHLITGSGNLYDIDLHSATGIYVVVGAGAFLATSSDLVSWTNRPLPSGVTGDLLVVTTVPGSAGAMVASGSLGGAWLRSVDAVTWSQSLLDGSDIVYCCAISTDTVVLGGSAGNIYVSTDQAQTFRKRNVSTAPILSMSQAQGDWILGLTSGDVLHSTDLINWTAGNVGVAADVLAISTQPPVYAVVGNGGMVQASADAMSWDSVTVDVSAAKWNKIRVLGGLAVLLGDLGRMFVTTDFVSFRQIPTGTTNNLFDITLNTASGKWSVVGASGYIATTTDLSASTPIWTAPPGYTPVGYDLIRIVWDATLGYTICGASAVLKSSDLTSGIAPQAGLIAGMVCDGTAFVQFGAGGTILRATSISGPWARVSSPTSANLLCGIAQGGVILLGGAGGILLRSTDHGATWTSIASSISQNINALAWNAGTSKLGCCTSACGVYQSADLGLTWSSINGSGFSGTPDLLAMWARGSEWNVCGATGTWGYTTSTSWSMRSTGVTAMLYAGEGDTAVGASGTILSISSGSLANWTIFGTIDSLGVQRAISADLRRLTQGVILDSLGVARVLSATGLKGTPTDLLGSSTTALASDGAGNLYAVGSEIWSSKIAEGYLLWTRRTMAFAGVKDLSVASGSLYAVGLAGMVVSSADGLVWNWVGQKYDAADHYSVGYYRYGEPILDFVGVRAFAQGTRLVLGGVGGLIWSGVGALVPALSAARIDADHSTAAVPLVSTAPGSIQSSSLRDLSVVGSLSDSSLSRFSGSLRGTVVRSQIRAVGSLSVPASLIIAESSLTKNDTLDASRAPLFAFSGSTLQIADSVIDANGSLMYTEDTTAQIQLLNCQNPNGFDIAFSNGYAVASYNAAAPIRHSGLKWMNGHTVNLISTAQKLAYAHASADNSPNWQYLTGPDPIQAWRGLPAGTTQVGGKIIVGGDTPISSMFSKSTIRYYGFPEGVYSYDTGWDSNPFVKSMFRALSYGAAVFAEIILPSGKKIDSGLRVAFVWGGLQVDAQEGTSGTYTSLLPSSFGESGRIGRIPAGGKAKISAYSWGGNPAAYVQSSGNHVYYDIYGKMAVFSGGGSWPPISMPVVVVYADSPCVIPAGTTIDMTVCHAVPTGRGEFEAFFPAAHQRYQGTMSANFVYEHQKSFRDSDVNGLHVASAWLSDYPSGGDGNLPVISE